MVVVSSSDGGDVTPPFPPDWPGWGAVEEVMAVVRTPGDITVEAGSTDGMAWVGLVVVPERSKRARHVDKHRHTQKHNTSDVANGISVVVLVTFACRFKYHKG